MTMQKLRLLWKSKEFYSDAYSFRETDYSNDIYGRPHTVFGEGEAWRKANRNIGTEYRFNDENDSVSVFFVGSDLQVIEAGVYGKNTLYTSEYTDEDGKLSVEFRNSNGNIILIRQICDDGNRLKRIVEWTKKENYMYEYDGNGNVTYDGSNGNSLSYNELGLLSSVYKDNVSVAQYCYLQDASKLSALDAKGNGLYYIGSMIYSKGNGTIAFESTGFSCGRIVNGGQGVVPYYYIADYLGSIRSVIDSTGAVVASHDYFPSGLQWGALAAKNTDNEISTMAYDRYLYNGKEYQSFLGIGYLDFGQRMYDPRYRISWMTVDPLAEKAYAYSPYLFCKANPLRNIDPAGLSEYIVGGKTMKIDDGDNKFRMKVSAQEFRNLSDRYKNDPTGDLKLRYSSYRNRLSKNNGFYTDDTGTGSWAYHDPSETYLSYQTGGDWKDVAGDAVSSAINGASDEHVMNRMNVGDNGKIYFRKKSGHIFHGNQYVKVQSMMAKYGTFIDGVDKFRKGLDLYSASADFKSVYEYEGEFGINTWLFVMAKVAGGALGEGGAWFGRVAGSALGTFASPAGSVVGGMAGSAAGSYIGSWLGEKYVTEWL